MTKPASLVSLMVGALWFSPHVRAITIPTVFVCNPGNFADTRYIDSSHPNGVGSVAKSFNIGQTEVTNAQYVEFLNGVDPSGANVLGVYDSKMSSNTPSSPNGGIRFTSGAPTGSKYGVRTGADDWPVVYISWFSAIRFANWLNNGQGSGDTESGAYTLKGHTRIPTNANSITRNSLARWWLPSEDEWYKAAYHKNDGVTANYWDYPTATNSQPYSAPPPGTNAPAPANTANFYKTDHVANGYDDGFAVTGATSCTSLGSCLTDVGAYTLSASAYGTFDQGGNAWEWNDTLFQTPFSGLCPGVRGGTYDQTGSDQLIASSWVAQVAGVVYPNFGFRVASSPAAIGDFNGDRGVDAADYAVWRKSDGSAAGYETWRANFGRPIAGSGSTIANSDVPEPCSLALLFGVAFISLLAGERLNRKPSHHRI
jgi:sulfatase modifying factor 1